MGAEVDHFLTGGDMQEEGQAGDEDVCLHAFVGLVVDGSHVDHVLEICERTLDLAQFLVDGHRLDRRQILLFGLNDVLALIGLFPLQVQGMLEEAEAAVL